MISETYLNDKVFIDFIVCESGKEIASRFFISSGSKDLTVNNSNTSKNAFADKYYFIELNSVWSRKESVRARGILFTVIIYFSILGLPVLESGDQGSLKIT